MSRHSEALRAVDYTQRVLGVLPSNHIVQRILTLGESRECVATMRRRLSGERDHDRIMNIRRMAGLAKAAGCGNCGEYAAVAFDHLMLTGCQFALEYAGYVSPGDHAFVIVGRPAHTDPGDPSTWGANVVVCDAWAGAVVNSRSYWAQMPSFPHAVHAPEISVRWSGVGDFPAEHPDRISA